MELTYERGTINAALSLMLLATQTSGQPPRQQRNARCSMSICRLPETSRFPENNEEMLTAPDESPDSNNEKGLIVRREIRPVPLCLLVSLSLSRGVADPVRMKCPKPPFLSTIVLTESHSSGIRCHSSIRRGDSPSRSLDGDIAAIAAYSSYISGSPSSTILLETCFALVVLPHHLGPSINTAPLLSR